jgi:hypothetical protein
VQHEREREAIAYRPHRRVHPCASLPSVSQRYPRRALGTMRRALWIEHGDGVVEPCDPGLHQALKKCESSSCGVYRAVGARWTSGADNAESFNNITYFDCDVRRIAGLMVRVANSGDASKCCVWKQRMCGKYRETEH